MRIKLILLGFVTLQIFLLSCKQKDTSYTDFKEKEYRSLTEFEAFKGFVESGGIMIGTFDNIDYAFKHYMKDSIDIIAYEKVIKTSSGKANYTLVDVLEIKGLKENQYISYGLCRMNEKIDSEIIAVYQVDDQESEFYKNVIKAWKVNRLKGKIEPIDINGIDCINEGYGV